MDKDMFKSYKFKPSDVIEGLNRYFAETKAFRYRRVPLEIRRGVCYNNPDCVKDIVFGNNPPERATKAWCCWHYYLICDPEEVVGVAINWLREEHDIFYTPGMNEPPIKDPDDVDDFCVDDAAKEYEKAKAARAELAYLYKTVLGKDRLDRDLSPHEVMKAILDEYNKREEFIRELSCSLGFGNPVVKPDNIDQKEKDILKRVEKLKDGVWPCENSSTFAEHLRKEFPKFCKEYNVAPLAKDGSIHYWLQYIFDVLTEYRDLANNNFNKAEGFRKEKRAVENVLAELRAKIREIYRSVVDDEWDEHLAYTSALNDINEVYKRVVHIFEERTADWIEAHKELYRYKLAVGSLLRIPKESRDDINAIERSFDLTSKKYASLNEFRNDVCEILDIPSSMADDQKQVLKEIHDFADRYYELKDFRADICEALGIDADELFGSPQQNDKYILEQVEKLKKTPNRDTFRDAICNALNMPTTSINGNIIGRIHMRQDCHNKLCKDYTELRKAIWEAMDRKPETLPDENARLVGEVTELARGEKLLIDFRDAVAKAIGMDYPTTNQVILNNVQYIYKDREDAYGIVSKLHDQVTALEKAKEDLQKDYDELGEAYSSVLKWNNSYAEVRRLLEVSADADADEMVDALDQLIVDREKCKRRYENWYSRYESEHERANGEHKRAEKLRKDVTVLTNHIELLKISNASQANSVVASQAFKNECRKLKEEKAKVIAALGQEIWDDCVKEEENNE